MQVRLNILNNGQELQVSDLNAVAQAASAADDQVWNEFLRLIPYNGSTFTKAIFPYGSMLGAVGATVTTNGATGSVLINPFRAFVGSRTAVGTSAALNWTDIRSQYFVGGATSLTASQSLAANASGNPRWDLVYAAVAVDASTANVTRYIKSPTTKVVTPTAVSVSLNTTVTIGVVTGTPGANPALPTLPTDAGGTYYIPLAYVWVPNAFGAGSTVATKQIRDQAPIVGLSRTTGGGSIRVANGNNDGAGTYATNTGWGVTGQRPGPFVPPDLTGFESLIGEIDTINNSHPNASVFDSSVDWRNRFFFVFCQAFGNRFGNDPAGSGLLVPCAKALGGGTDFQISNSFGADATYVANTSTIYNGTNANNPGIAGATQLALYVSQTNGQMLVYINSAPTCRAFFWIFASAPFPNY